MERRFVLHYILDNPETGKVLTFEFDKDIDYKKYNNTILEMYGKRIKKRYVLDKESGEIMSLKKLDGVIQSL